MKTRVLSGIVLAAILLPVVYIGGFYYYIALGTISLFAYKEIIALPYFKSVPSAIKIFGVLFYLPIVFSSLMDGLSGNLNYLYLIMLFVYLLIPSIFYTDNEYTIKDGLLFGSLVTFIAVGFASFIYARSSFEIFLYLISIPILSDTFAMITGSLIGKNKLCANLSPKKTVEGAFGGLVLGVLVPLILYYYLVDVVTLNIISMTICLALFSQLGDLIFSKIKRENDIKDYSDLIPGHGGVLDRLDSVMFVSIIYLVFSSIL